MGNLQKALKENEHLKNQNKGLLDALKRKNGQLEEYKEDSARALREISDMVSAYIGAICLGADEHKVRIEHADVSSVLANFDIEIETDEIGIIFRLVEKNKE